MDFDGRGANRVETENLLAFRLFDKKDAVINEGMVKTIDISRTGIAIQSQITMDVGYKIELTIGMGDEVVQATGAIQNQKKLTEQSFQIGIEFDFLSEDDLNKIGMVYPSILK